MIKKIVVLGAGNVASHFVSAINKTDIRIVQIYNRTIDKAKLLAESINSEAIDNVKNIDPTADAYFFMLTDSGITEISKHININDNKLLVHTAGSVSMNIFKEKSENFGVFYPFQTFTKDFPVDFEDAPICIEASNDNSFNLLKILADQLKCKSLKINENERKIIHLSGVFACNFMNHCIFLGEKILEENKIDKKIIAPLLEQSFKKVLVLGADKSQTGPAKRDDKEVINKHLELLKDEKNMSEVYKILTESIINTYKNEL